MQIQTNAKFCAVQVAAAIMPMPRTESATRARPEGLRPAEPMGGGPSAVMVVEQKQSAWQKQWQNMQGKVLKQQITLRTAVILDSGHSLFHCMSRGS